MQARKVLRFSRTTTPYILIHRFTSRLKFDIVTFRKLYSLNKGIGQIPNLPLANYMSFSSEFQTLSSGNSYHLRTQPKISTHGDENTGVAETGLPESSEEGHIRFSPELVDERIKASLEPLLAQVSALTEMMDRLIQSNLTTESTTASSQGPRLQHESPYSEGPGSSKFPTVAPLTTAGYSPDSDRFFPLRFEAYDYFLLLLLRHENFQRGTAC